MWDRLTLVPLALSNWLCPSRTSDTILLALVAWCFGVATGASITAVLLSPWLRRCLLRGAAFALAEAVPELRPTDRLQRYRQ